MGLGRALSPDLSQSLAGMTCSLDYVSIPDHELSRLLLHPHVRGMTCLSGFPACKIRMLLCCGGKTSSNLFERTDLTESPAFPHWDREVDRSIFAAFTEGPANYRQQKLPECRNLHTRIL